MKGGRLGPLHGIPVSIKDLALVQGVPARFGSHIFATRVGDVDAPYVRRLKEAGAILTGKTTTPEFGWKALGDSPLTGITRNPWNLGMTSGGSSAGAGAATAAGLGPLHQGSDGAGSIRVPSAFCGIYGLKPTFGRVPMWPVSNTDSASHTGPMTRTVADAALMLGVMAGPDDWDRQSLDAAPDDYVGRLRAGVKGLRVGWSLDLGCLQVDPEVGQVAKRAALAFQELGCAVEDVKVSWPDTREMIHLMWNAHYAGNYGQYLDEFRSRMDPGLVAALEDGRRYSAEAYVAMRGRKHVYCDAVRATFDTYDLLLDPDGVGRGLRGRAAQSGGLPAARVGLVPVGRRSAIRSTSPGSPPPPSPPASPPRACRWACRSSAAAWPTSRCCRPRPPSSRRGRGRRSGPASEPVAARGGSRRPMSARPYDVITFDCYGTLIDWEGGHRERVHARGGRDRRTARSRDGARRPTSGSSRWCRPRHYRSYRDVLTESARRGGRRALGWALPEARAGFLAESLPFWNPFPDTNAALERLFRAGYQLGILSNVDDDLLAGTRRHFTVPFDLHRHRAAGALLQAGDGHFTTARERIGGRRWLHAAQSHFHDVTPRRRLGVPVAWINRKSEAAAGEPAADRELSDPHRAGRLARLAPPARGLPWHSSRR